MLCRKGQGSGFVSCTMAEIMTFTPVVSPAVMCNVGIPEPVLRMWGWLREGTIYFLQFHRGQHTTAQIEAAQRSLLQYACEAQRAFKHKLCTLLLHRAVVHIPWQAQKMGCTAFAAEWWGERCVQDIKQDTVGHSTKDAPLSALNMQLQRQALATAECLRPQVLALGPERRQPVGSTDGNGAVGVQLLGVLVEARPGKANAEHESEVC